MSTDRPRTSSQKVDGKRDVILPFGLAPKCESMGDTHDGTVVSIAGDRLVVATTKGREYAFRVRADAHVCCDGVACRVADLKVGSVIRLTTSTDDKNSVTRIESAVQQTD